MPHPPEFLDNPPPICRGAADRTLRKLLPPKCPPPPPWNPPPPLLPLWNPPPPREPPWLEPPPPREPPPRCLPNANAAFGAPARARATMEVNRTLKTVGALISVSSSRRMRTGRNRDLQNRGQKRRGFSPRLHLPAYGIGRISVTSCPLVSQQLRDRQTEKASC